MDASDKIDGLCPDRAPVVVEKRGAALAAAVAPCRVVTAGASRLAELGLEPCARGMDPYRDRLDRSLAGEAAACILAIPDRARAARQRPGMIDGVVFWPRPSIVDLRIEEAVAEGAVATMRTRSRVRP